MRKLISLFLILSLNAYGQSEPITRLKVEGSGTFVPGTNIQVPNETATKINGSTSRLETNNTNLLKDPSFEGATLNAAWTLTNATSAVTSVDVTDGKKALTVTPTLAGGGIKQISTLYASKIMGGQGVAKVSVKTTGSDVYVCPLINGARPTDYTKYCAKVPTSTASVPFPEVIVPFILDGTSNGIEVYSLGTSVFTVDESFVGKSNPLQSVSGARLVGEAVYSGTGASFTTSSSTFQFATSASQSVAYSGGLSAPTATSNGIGVKIPTMQAGNYIIKVSGASLATANTTASNNYMFASIGSDDIATSTVCGQIESSANLYNQLDGVGASDFSCSYSTNLNLTNKEFIIKARTSTNGVNASTVSLNSGAKISVYYFPPESKIYSLGSSADSIANVGEVFAYAGTTCPSGSLLANGAAVSRATYSELFSAIGVSHGSGDGLTTFNIPDYRGRFLRGVDGGAGRDPDKASRTAMNTGGNTGDAVGTVQGQATAKNGLTLSDPGHSHVQSKTNSTSAGTTGAPGQPTNTAGSVVSAIISTQSSTTGITQTSTDSETRPINANVNYCVRYTSVKANIAGSFEGIEKCANDYECTDTFSAKVDISGNVSGENLDWINGNCSIGAAGQFTCPVVSGIFTVLPNCTVTAIDSAVSNAYGAKFDNTSILPNLLVYTINTSSGNGTTRPFNIKCQKAGQDYKPKTAKVASSIGVPTVPNAGTSAIDTFSFSYGKGSSNVACDASPCTYLDQIGGAVVSSGVTRTSMGRYPVSLSKSYSKIKCTGWCSGTTSCAVQFDSFTASSFNIITQNSTTGSVFDTYGTIYCQGSY